MSDHKHPHDHDHGSGHTHDHDHDHDHHHGQHHDHHDDHDHGPAPESGVDAGSHALAEALRSSFGIVKVVMVILVLVFLGSGFFQVGPNEQAIILRFGKPVGEGRNVLLGPGLHWSYPYPIDKYVKVRVNEVQRVTSTVGWFYTTPEAELAGSDMVMFAPSLNPAQDGYVLTADANIIHARATLVYRIEDPVRYVFGFANVSNAVENAANNALLHAAARFTVDDILTRDIAGFRDAVRRRATELLEQQDVGIVVDDCVVRTIAPRQLRAAFDNVVRAEVTRSKNLDDARSYENQVVSRATADADSRINRAESERVLVVQNLASQAERFQELLPRYQRNPELFRMEWLTTTMGRVLSNAQDKIYLSERADGKARELRLLLNREPLRPQNLQTNN